MLQAVYSPLVENCWGDCGVGWRESEMSGQEAEQGELEGGRELVDE